VISVSPFAPGGTRRVAEPVQLIPTVQPGQDAAFILVTRATSPEFADAVARVGGSARFSIAASATPDAAIDVVAKASNRDAANRTLAIVDSAMRRDLINLQTKAGTPPRDLYVLATIARRTA